MNNQRIAIAAILGILAVACSTEEPAPHIVFVASGEACAAPEGEYVTTWTRVSGECGEIGPQRARFVFGVEQSPQPECNVGAVTSADGCSTVATRECLLLELYATRYEFATEWSTDGESGASVVRVTMDAFGLRQCEGVYAVAYSRGTVTQ